MCRAAHCDSCCAVRLPTPHPDPLPEYRERENAIWVRDCPAVALLWPGGRNSLQAGRGPPRIARQMGELDVSQLVTVSQAIAAIAAVGVTPRTVGVALGEGGGRGLARDGGGDRDSPP